MKKFISACLCLGILACAAGIIFGLINEISRPYVITFVVLCWLPCLWEMKNAPTAPNKHFSKV